MRVVAIIPAAGLGVRMARGRTAQGAAPPKPLLELDAVPILFWTLRKLAACPRIERLIVAVRPADRAGVEARLRQEDYAGRVRVVDGGESRQESVANALEAVPAGADLVLVHDAVRPFVEPALIERVIEAGAETGAAILGLPAADTVKQVEPAAGGHASRITATLPRERIVLAQTPQVFRCQLLKEAMAAAARDGFRASDEAGLVERLGHPVTVVMGSERNLKITTPADLALARLLLSQEKTH
ncbi:MAG: 2-C-methyl-D-erythritol 4-phosphate cytidylyltransferase [Acidobacteria bacterium]|nr:2-C-methyl-D-erythritol 4-phosphate cytidylyltransferase [Acidobacteriota bacterium]